MVDKSETDHFYFIVYPDPFIYPNKEEQKKLNPHEEETKKALQGQDPVFWIKFGDEKGYGTRPSSYGNECEFCPDHIGFFAFALMKIRLCRLGEGNYDWGGS